MVPYPSAEEAFQASNTHAPTDDFSSLGLSDFFIAHRRVAHCRLDRLSLSGNTQELLSRGVRVSLERREPYDPILEASIGYAGAAAVAVMDEVAFVNERQDERMEGIEEGALSLVPRVSSVEEENRQLREVQRAQEERIIRDLPPFVRTSNPSPAHSASPPLQRSPHLHDRVIDAVPDQFPISSLSLHGSLSAPP